MNRIALTALILILVLPACAPSQSQLATSAAETELASPSETPLPSATPSFTPSPIPTDTKTPSPTPDLRVVDGDPALMLLSAEDLSEVAVYYQTTYGRAEMWKPPYRNQDLINDFGEEKAAKYIADSGRIEGRGIIFATYTNAPEVPELILSEVAIFAASTGPLVDASEVSPMDICKESPLYDWVPVDIGVEASACYTKLTMMGEWTKDFHILQGAYRNVSFKVTAIGTEDSLPEEVLVGIGKLQLEKIMGFPLADEVTYSP